MNIPLMVMENDRSLSVVRNGEIIEVPFDALPSKPYVLVESDKNDPKAKPFRDLATKDPVYLVKEEFETSRDAYDRYNNLRGTRCYHGRVIEQTFLDTPDFFTQPIYQQTKPLKVVSLDIEVLSDGSGVFPKPDKTPIISIGAGELTVTGQDIKMGDVKVFMNYSDQWKDREILAEFLDWFKKKDFDVVTGFNLKFFDIPYIIQRLFTYKEKNGRVPRDLYPGLMTRTFQMPFSKKREEGDDDQRYDLQGRVIMDLYENALRDQSLSTIKNRKLKTLLKWFDYKGHEIVEIDTRDMRKYVNDPKLAEYQTSDVMGTGDCLFRNYFGQSRGVAEMMKLPLDTVINGYSSTVPKIYTGRRCMSLGLIPLDNNELRYGNTRFEAAYVDIYKTGRFETIYKFDVSAMYPSIMITFNLGPDTTKMNTMQLPYNPDGFSVSKGKDKLLIEVPDKNLKRNMLITVDTSKNSFVREDLLRLGEIRAKTKSEMKKFAEGSPEWTALNSENWGAKVLANSVYGLHGLKFSKFGDLSISFVVVAVARMIIKKSVEMLGDICLETDTDGIMTSGDYDVDYLNTSISGMITQMTGQKSYIRFEKEGPWVGYLYMAKNYVLRKPVKGKLLDIFHGNSMKSSKTSAVYDRAIHTLATAVLDGLPHEVLKEKVFELRDPKNYTLQDFMMHIKLTQDEYKNAGAMQVALMAQAAEVLGRKVGEGDTIDYYTTKDGYLVSEKVTSLDQIDWEYYLEAIEKAQKIFGLGDIHKTPEQLVREARWEREARLQRRKLALSKEPTENMRKEFPDLPLPKGKAEEELSVILHLQEAMSKHWPCPNCGGSGYDPEPPLLRCVGCGWSGTPIRPVKPKGLRKKKELLPDGTVRVTVGEKSFLLPRDWRSRKQALKEKYEMEGYLGKEEWNIVSYTEPVKKEAVNEPQA